MDDNIFFPHVQAILWDMDGTLVESEDCYQQALEEMALQYGFSLPTHIPDGLGLDKVYLMIQETVPLSYEVWEKELNQRALYYMTHKSPRAGIMEVLTILQQRGYPMSVVSNTVHYQIEKTMHEVGISSFFDHFVGRDQVAYGKPSPHPYLLSAERHGIAPINCLVVEDTPVGIAAAESADMVAVAFPNRRTQELDFSKADVRIDQVQQLLDFLPKNH